MKVKKINSSHRKTAPDYSRICGPGLFGVVASSLVLLTVTMLTSDTGKNAEEFLAQAHRPDTD